MATADSILAVKKCSVCGATKLATTEFFHPNAGGKYGLRGQCRDCRKQAVRASLQRPEVAARRKALHDHYVSTGRYAEMKREWAGTNAEKAKAIRDGWRQRNPEKHKASEQQYRDANRDKIRAKQRRADAKAQRNPLHVLNKRIKGRIRDLLRGSYEPGTIGKHLAFTRAELVAHIERQFTVGMTWDRLLAGEIHVDHIVPIAAFDVREIGDAEFRACWSLGNLRPLWAIDNWAKQKRVVTLL